MMLLLLLACPDPTAVEGPTLEGPVPMLPEAGADNAGGAARVGDPPPGEGSVPPAGDGTGTPGAPPAGGGGGKRPEIAGFQVAEADGVKLSGTVSYAGSQQGTLRVDFLKNSTGSSFPELAHTLTLDAPGPWSVVAPKSLGDLSIVAYLDAGNNGPSPGEAAGMLEKVTVGKSNVDNLEITLSDTPDLGELAPTAKGQAADGSVTPPPVQKGAGLAPTEAPAAAVGTPATP